MPIKKNTLSILTSLFGLLLAGMPSFGASPFELHKAYNGAFEIGVALNSRTYLEKEPVRYALARDQFSLVVAENDFKWATIHPEIDRFDFTASDALVEMALEQGKKIHGHVLIWHQAAPDWIFEDGNGNAITRDTLIERMQDHIRTIVTRYKGMVQTWDVVNEAFNDDGTMRQSKWRQIIGDDYIEIAHRTAHEADPEAKLVYNDYSWANDAKRAAIIAMAEDFLERGVPIHALGIQGHWQLDYPSIEKIETILTDAASTGLEVMITELDIDVLPTAWEHIGADISELFEYQEELDPYTRGLPASVQKELSDRYQALFAKFLEHRESLYTVTFWGLTESDTWLNYFPVRGRTNYPLLFDREGDPKPAYYSVISLAPNLQTPSTTSTDAYHRIPLHRFHRASNNSHFFTANDAEYQFLLDAGDQSPWRYEGISHYVVANHTLQSVPVYRLFNRVSGSHFYTAIRDELVMVLSNPHRTFRYEGIGFYTLLSPEFGTLPVYRFFSPSSGSHFFTIDEGEKNVLQSASTSLSYDGVSWFGFP